MRGRERERESGRRRKEAEDDRDEQRVTREREKEGGRFCRGSGCRFTNPLRPPPVRFPPFRFVSNLEWRFWPRAREEREERKGKWRSRRAQRPPPLPCSTRDFGGRRGNAETMLSISPSKIFRSKKSLFCVSGTTSFSPPARSSSRGWIFFYQGLDSVGGRAGETLRKVSKGMECPRSRLASTDFNPLPHPPPRGVETRARRRRLANSSKE